MFTNILRITIPLLLLTVSSCVDQFQVELSSDDSLHTLGLDDVSNEQRNRIMFTYDTTRKTAYLFKKDDFTNQDAEPPEADVDPDLGNSSSSSSGGDDDGPQDMPIHEDDDRPQDMPIHEDDDRPQDMPIHNPKNDIPKKKKAKVKLPIIPKAKVKLPPKPNPKANAKVNAAAIAKAKAKAAAKAKAKANAAAIAKAKAKAAAKAKAKANAAAIAKAKAKAAAKAKAKAKGAALAKAKAKAAAIAKAKAKAAAIAKGKAKGKAKVALPRIKGKGIGNNDLRKASPGSTAKPIPYQYAELPGTEKKYRYENDENSIYIFRKEGAASAQFTIDVDFADNLDCIRFHTVSNMPNSAGNLRGSSQETEIRELGQYCGNPGLIVTPHFPIGPNDNLHLTITTDLSGNSRLGWQIRKIQFFGSRFRPISEIRNSRRFNDNFFRSAADSTIPGIAYDKYGRQLNFHIVNHERLLAEARAKKAEKGLGEGHYVGNEPITIALEVPAEEAQPPKPPKLVLQATLAPPPITPQNPPPPGFDPLDEKGPFDEQESWGTSVVYDTKTWNFPKEMPKVSFPSTFKDCSAAEKEQVKGGWTMGHYMLWRTYERMRVIKNAHVKHRELLYNDGFRDTAAKNASDAKHFRTDGDTLNVRFYDNAQRDNNWSPKAWFGTWNQDRFNKAYTAIMQAWRGRFRAQDGYVRRIRRIDCTDKKTYGGRHYPHGVINLSRGDGLDRDIYRLGALLIHEAMHRIDLPVYNGVGTARENGVQDYHRHSGHGGSCKWKFSVEKMYHVAKATHLARDPKCNHMNIAPYNNDNYRYFALALGRTFYEKKFAYWPLDNRNLPDVSTPKPGDPGYCDGVAECKPNKNCPEDGDPFCHCTEKMLYCSGL